MEYYAVVDKPASARMFPDPTAAIINAFPSNTKIPIIKEASGWLQTDSGQWILKSENIISYKEYIKRFPQKSEYLRPMFKDAVGFSSNFAASALKSGSQVKLNGNDMTDPVTGNTLPKSYVTNSTIFIVDSIESDGSIKLKDASTGDTFHASVTGLTIYNESDNTWTDVSAEAVQQQQEDQQIISSTQSVVSSTADSIADLDNINITHTRSVFGMPYQFLPIADNRIDGTYDEKIFGRKYAQKIVSRMPILILQAGVPNFMKGWSKSAKEKVLTALSSAMTIGTNDTTLSEMINKAGNYYCFKATPTNYFDTVTPMCRAMATFLNIDTTMVTLKGESQPLGKVNWLTQTQNSCWGYYAGSIAFYVNSEPQVNESFNNSTAQSQIASKMNEIGKVGSELQFLLGGASGKTGLETLGATGAESAANGTYKNTGSIMDSLIGNIQTLIAGGRMAFPEIWQDSSFMRSYNVTIKLDSPDCDTVSIYLNILVPLAHILGMVAPRSLAQNNYISPFLVRAYYKSMFHIDMGIITDCQIQKGDVGAWTQNGLPTQVTIQLTIKDLYDVMSVALNNGKSDLVGNPAQLDYIASLCGINIGTPDITRTWKLWCAIRGLNRLSDNVSNGWRNLMINCYRKWYNLWDTNYNM